MSNGDQVYVRPADLTAAGEAAEDIGERMLKDDDEADRRSKAAVTGHPGWEVSAALTECNQSWWEQLTEVAKDVRATGDKLVSNADAYAKTDETHAQAVREFYTLPVD